MRLRQLGIRHRVFAACLLVSLASVAVMIGFGITLRRVLRQRARQSSVCIAAMFAEHAHQRLLRLSGESAALAEVLAEVDVREGERGWSGGELAESSLRCSWALYDPDGRRRLGHRAPRHEAALQKMGIGTEQVVERERGRFAAALAGRPNTVLVPHQGGAYTLVYRPVVREDGSRWVLQVMAPATDGEFRSVGDVRAVLRPFVAAVDEPRVMRVDGRLRMVVHWPLRFCGRQLGTVSAAVPYDQEARVAQGAMAAVIVIAGGATLVLAVLSYVLTDVAMVPLEEVRDFVRNHQAGCEVERPGPVGDDAIASLFESFQEMIDQSQRFADQLMDSNRALRDLLTGAVGALVNAIEANDGYTAGHSQRVADMACAIAREMGWIHPDVEQLRLGAMLHDIGKLGISHNILNKPGSLDDGEWELIRQHPVIGSRILSAIPQCEDVIDIVQHHHEHFSGSGYPEGLAGEDIGMGARIVAVADVYDALTSKRSYRDAYSAEEAMAILEQGAGTMHDPEIVAAFLGLLRRDAEAQTPRRDSPGEPQTEAAPAPAASS
ncbi:MAG: HD-GYP domain-containing protein [Planctomycetota bacterium]